MAGKEPPKKKRKRGKGSSSFNVSELKCLEGAERSEVVSNGPDFWEDKELWVVQLPKNCDMSMLDQQEISLKTITPVVKVEKTSYEVRPFPGKRKTSTLKKYVALSSSSKPGRLRVGPGIKGYASVHQCVDIPAVKFPSPCQQPKVILPQNLKRRWKPFGHK